MAGNPFEEGLRAPLALALLADRLSGQIPAALLLWSDLHPAVNRGGQAFAGTRRVEGNAGHDVSFPLTATGDALGLPTLLGRKSWH